MTVISISDTLSRLPPPQTKVYQRLYDTFGYELGIGRRGVYPGHAHLHFCDLMFSPDGIATGAKDGTSVNGRLVVVPPRTYFSDTTIADFFFVKFCPDPGPIMVPDKIGTLVNEGRILVFETAADIQLTWFSSSIDAGRTIQITLRDSRLKLQFANVETILVEP